jgi:L-iditol 2-dehydrogenase
MPRSGQITVGEFAVPEPSNDQVLVKMQRASICGSDVHTVFHGFGSEVEFGKPGYPGHEGVGEIVNAGSSHLVVGTPVLTVPIGNSGGCFADYQVLGESYVVPLPAGGDPARLLMAQQLGTTIYGMRKFWPVSGEGKVAAIIGAGSAGLFFLQLLMRAGFETVLVSDLNQQRLRVAGLLGADLMIEAPRESIYDAVMDVTGGLGADLVVEAAGFDRCRADAIRSVRERGTVGLFGFPESPGMSPFPGYLAFRKSVRIEHSAGTQSEPGLRSFRDALVAIDSGVIDVSYCLNNTFTLEQVPEAMEVARDQGRGAVKLTVVIGP